VKNQVLYRTGAGRMRKKEEWDGSNLGKDMVETNCTLSPRSQVAKTEEEMSQFS
jgi:hypothetical protein